MKNYLVTLVLLFTQQLITAQNVGIGTKNPQAKLDVHGNVRIDSIPQVTSVNYLLGVDQNGFLLKTPNSQISTQQENFPDLVGWGFGIMNNPGSVRPYSFYRVNTDKLFFNGTLMFYQSDSLPPQSVDVQAAWVGGGAFLGPQQGAVSLGNYLYIAIFNSTTNQRRVYRYNRSNIAAGTIQMSFTGLQLNLGTSSSPGVIMTSDGTYFYFNYNAGNSANDNVIAKYSISGTTFQYVSSVTLGSVGDFNKSFLVDAAGNYYGASLNSQNLFKKFTSSGNLIYSWKESQTFFMNWLDHFYSSRNNSYETYERFNK